MCPDWIALLYERVESLNGVARRHELVQVHSLGGRHEVSEADAPRGNRRPLNGPQRGSASLTERLQHFSQGLVQVALFNHLAYKADLGRRGCLDRVAGQ